MKRIIYFIKLLIVGVFTFILPIRVKPSNALSNVDKRIETIRKTIKYQLQNKDGKAISFPFKNYTTNLDWVNWSNWGNWNNWNNWAKWNNWANWNNWNNWINY